MPSVLDFSKYPPNTFDVLDRLVDSIRCKPGWNFRLQDENGALTLVIRVDGPDSYPPHESRLINHHHRVPVTEYNEASWTRWIFEQCRRVENHELGEWFKIGDERPFAPLHGPGEDPYSVNAVRSQRDAETTQTGEVWPMSERPT